MIVNLAAVMSILLHVYILSIKIEQPKLNPNNGKGKKKIDLVLNGNSKEGGGKKKEDIYVIPKEVQEIVDKLNEEIKKEQMVATLIKKECKKFYTGIGIIYNPWKGDVTKVAKGSPAEKAGIKVGDILLDSGIRDKYEEGTVITIPTLREGIIHDIPVTIGKICTENKP